MGGERASTARQRLAGKICCNCKVPLTPNGRVGERYCDACGPHHAVVMRFEFFGSDWIVNFTMGGRPITRTRVLRHDVSILTLVKRGNGNLAAAEEALQIGKGVLPLTLTDTQLRKLKG